MATIKSEMPPLHAAESTASTLSSMGSGGVSSGGGGTNGSTGNATNNTTTNTTTSSASGTNTASANNTISAAADSSDNQPGTPQPQTPQIGVNDQQQQQQQQSQQSATSTDAHNPYAAHNMYGSTSTTTAGTLPHMYSGGIYATSTGSGSGTGHDMQQQQQQHATTYPSYLSSYEQFYQQQGHAQSANTIGSGNSSSSLDFSNASTLYNSNSSNDFKSSSASAGVRYHPYLQTPTSNGVRSANDGTDMGVGTVPNVGLPLSSNSGAVSTTTLMSPRIVSSSSPTSTSNQLHMSNSGNGSGNPQSPNCGQQILCKKCGIMCANDTELQEHITNVHGASPYGSSGYSSSPYIKEELSSGPPNPPQQQQQTGANPNELLDLDSQKMVYPPMPGSMQSIMGHSGLHHQQHHAMHDSIVSDPLHSMHTMQQRALPNWDQAPAIGGTNVNAGQEGLPPYMQQTDISQKPNQSPYYSPKQSPYHSSNVPGVTNIKQEYPIIKSEYADSQNYVDKSFDPTIANAADMCQQPPNANSQQSMLPVSSSPAEFPSTTTGTPQEQQQPYRGFEPPTSSSVLPANSITAKAASWKSNEARRPKTYNCTACNKWFTSSGHLKRHYNTTLHKNAVKTSGQPDPATLPISAHHHPARDSSGKPSRRGGNNSAAAAAAAAAAQQQKPPAPVQPPEPPRTPPDYTAATQQQATASNNGMPFGQQNGYQQQQQPYLPQVQSTTNASPQHGSSAIGATQSQNQSETVLNGHPNGLAGPSAHITTTAAQPTLLMPSSPTRGLLNTITTITNREISEEDINTTIHHSPMDMVMMGKTIPQLPPQQAPLDEEAETAVIAEPLELQTHHQLLVKQELPDLEVQDYQLLDLQQRHYHNNTPNNQAQSPLTISHQQYQEHLQLQEQQMVADSIFLQQPQQVHMLPQPLQPNTMEAYNILGINTPPQHNNNTQQLSQRIINTTPTTANMDSIHMLPPHSLLRHLLPPDQEVPEHNTLNNITTINTPDTQQHNTIITPHMPLPSIIPSYQPVPQPEAPLPLEPTMNYHTIIGNNQNGNFNAYNTSSSDESGSEFLQLGTYDPYGSASMFTTNDGQILQLISNNGLMQPTYFSTFPTRTAAVAESYVRSYSSSSTTQRSPQEADLPPESPLSHVFHQTPQESQTTFNAPTDMPYSPTISSSTTADGNALIDEYSTNSNVNSENQVINESEAPKTATKTNGKRTKRSNATTASNSSKRKCITSGEKVSTPVSTTTGNIMLPSGRIKCLECDKEFTKICYLTQHNKCFHSGEYPYRCEQCGKRFQEEHIYTTHLGRHKSIDKPHKCELCPKQFHHKTDLRRHIEGTHTKNKQHTCDLCEKSFCRKDHLRKHYETHNKSRQTTTRRATNKTTLASKNLKKNSANAAKQYDNVTVANEALDSSPPSTSAQQQHHLQQHQYHHSDGGDSGVGGSDSSPLDIDCGALDLYVVIKNERHIITQDPNSFKMQSLNEHNHGDDIDVAEDDDDVDLDDDDEEFLITKKNNENILISHTLPHMQHNKLLEPL